jgi:predicted enzyme related to lactoylglutathione lyase
VLKFVDCVMYRVDDVDAAFAFYRDTMGLVPLWRDGGMAGLGFPESLAKGVTTELVLHDNPQIPKSDVNYKVDDVVRDAARMVAAGCTLVAGPFPIAIGQCAVVLDPFGNSLTLVDLTTGMRTPNL